MRLKMIWCKRLLSVLSRLSSVCVGFVGLLLSCSSPADVPAETGPDFMPLETGRYVIYDVTEQRYSLTAPPTTTTYQLKETVGTSYTDVTGQPAYRLQRYRRPTAQAAWATDSLWTARLTSRAAIRTENGADFVKLQFPLIDRDRWDGNLYNRFEEETYQLRNLRQPYSVTSQTFAETAQVVQRDDSTLVGRDKRVEIYARQVGLVYKETTQLQYCSVGPCVGKAQIDFGVRRVQRVVSYGKE
jgi:hypothetical protein